jgi:hypothetical protein
MLRPLARRSFISQLRKGVDAPTAKIACSRINSERADVHQQQSLCTMRCAACGALAAFPRGLGPRVIDLATRGQ